MDSLEVTPDHPIERIYAQIENELRNQQQHWLHASADGRGGKDRKRKLTTAQKGLVVRTRDYAATST
ncbi:hypothetical protein SBA3_1430009 [Candidatus Sulfopaludibacter sp. SbA3]|nr:hypothetical protein SBA3_1430009 [Candidatus Sulfopaludibacter sp. SbA3]